MRILHHDNNIANYCKNNGIQLMPLFPIRKRKVKKVKKKIAVAFTNKSFQATFGMTKENFLSKFNAL